MEQCYSQREEVEQDYLQLIYSPRLVGLPQHGDGLHAHLWPHFLPPVGNRWSSGVCQFPYDTHTLKQRYTSSLEWGKLFPSKETCPAQAVKAVYLFVRKCSRSKAALYCCARDDQPGMISQGWSGTWLPSPASRDLFGRKCGEEILDKRNSIYKVIGEWNRRAHLFGGLYVVIVYGKLHI